MPLNKTLPSARLVGGGLYKLAPAKDQNNNPKLDKDGKPMMTSYFAIAIPKKGEAWWWNTPWGLEIYNQGAADMPNNYQHPQFAWKIEDGDSVIPNKRGRMNKDREGYPGNWIIKFSSSFLPDVCTLLDPSRLGKPVRVLQEGYVQLGSWIQVAATIVGNKRTDSPGIYINPGIVCLVAYGPPITTGLDPDEAGFGGEPLPPGASVTPLAAPATVAAPAPAAPVGALPPAPAAAPAAAPPPAGPATVAAPPAPVPVAPHQTILAAPAAPSAVPPPPAAAAAPPPPAGPQMTAAAQYTYEGYIGSGWTEAQLIQHGLMLPR
jgi:hypothetical protein